MARAGIRPEAQREPDNPAARWEPVEALTARVDLRAREARKARGAQRLRVERRAGPACQAAQEWGAAWEPADRQTAVGADVVLVDVVVKRQQAAA